MKFAAIDIGSNAVRLAISRPLSPTKKDSDFKKIEFTRLPLRLGDEVFSKGAIGKKRQDLLEKSMKAFALLMEIYNVDDYMACATSAMRDASNAKDIVKAVKENSGIKIDIITGREESRLIQLAVLKTLPNKHDLLHIDIGGGSTELAYLKNGKVREFESFNIGTVRAREGKIDPKEKIRMDEWVAKLAVNASDDLQAIGTGGNMVKLNQISGTKSSEFNHIKRLTSTVKMLKGLSQDEKIYELKLNPDRAQVISFAGDIILNILKTCNITEIIAPNVGLKDGIMEDMWSKFHKKKD